MRVLKDPDVRRTEIMQVAEKLFESHGYAKTSVEAIIKQAGIAKGTFYYYFKTKQDILRALVAYKGSEISEYFHSITEETTLTAIEKLQRMLRSPNKRGINASAVMEIIHKPENRELQEELNVQSVKIIAPLLAQVLEQGHQEGIFDKTASVESIQLILAGSQFILDSGLFEWTLEKRAVFLKSIQAILEQMLGAEPGLLSFISEHE
jgi:AcrR family transcriptional regulator